MRLRAFFYYYGAKNRLALKYPAPMYQTIVEPFAGSAAYSLAYPDRRVRLFDLDERVCGVWDYLIRTSEREILALPDLPFDASVNDLPVCQEARWLIGYNLAAASQSVRTRWTPWSIGRAKRDAKHGPTDIWGSRMRQRIARQMSSIRHWRIAHAPWTHAPVMVATYFIDPPYQSAGRHYRHGAKDVDFSTLGTWCRSSPGQVIACEADGAQWLPFTGFAIANSQGRTGEPKGRGKLREVMWTNREPTQLELLRAEPDNDNGFAPQRAALRKG